jgi:hypothetical protein
MTPALAFIFGTFALLVAIRHAIELHSRAETERRRWARFWQEQERRSYVTRARVRTEQPIEEGIAK